MGLENKRQKKLAGSLFGTIVASMLFVGSAIGASAEVELQTVYHVYMDKNYLGKVSETAVVEETTNGLIKEKQENYADVEFVIGNEITYIPEQVFRTATDNEQVTERIQENAQVKANATAITVDDQALVYLKSEDEAKKVLEDYMKLYVSEEEWKSYQGRKEAEKLLRSLQAEDNIPKTDSKESQILDIYVKEDYKFAKVPVKIEDVVSNQDALQLLQKGTLEERKHVIKEGEVLGTIAKKYGMTIKQLLELNEGLKEDSILQIGQELNTVAYKPMLRVVVEREVYKEERVPYKKEVVENSSMPKGETKIKQKGKEGKSGFLYSVVEENGVQVKKETLEETVIEKPVTQIVEKGTKVIPNRGTGIFTWPTNGGYVSSGVGHRWGSYHKGIDIARPSNYTIKAADHGVVVSAGWHGGYGNKIVIDHRNGYRTVYAHLRSINVSVGQKVEKGQKIGVMGSTGNSTGIHLHFEVYKNGALKNPLSYF